MKMLVALVGMKYQGGEAIVAALPNGAPLVLKREPDNRFDPAAVQVWIMKDDGSEGRHVGYIKATQARPIAAYMDQALKGEPLKAKLAVDGGRWPMVEVES